MIKVDIINEVAKAADITKVRAEVAVEAVLEAMKDSLMKGERIELRGFGVFQVKPRKRGHRAQPPHGQGGTDPARAARSASSPARTCRASPSSRRPAWARHSALRARTSDLPTADSARAVPAGLGRARRLRLRARPGTAGDAHLLLFLPDGRLRLPRRRPADRGPAGRTAPSSALDVADGARLVAGLLEHPARPRDGPLPGRPLLRRRRDAALLHPVPVPGVSLVGHPRRLHPHPRPDPPPPRPLRHRRRRARSPGSSSACPCSGSGVREATVQPLRARRRRHLLRRAARSSSGWRASSTAPSPTTGRSSWASSASPPGSASS